MTMLKKLSLAELLGIIVSHIKEETGKPCYTTGADHEAPFYFVELQSTEPRDTKTMFIDHVSASIHAIAKATKNPSFAQALELVQDLEEAMTVDIAIPDPFYLVNQESDGMQVLKHDPSGEGHAVLTYSFDICYGLRIK